MMLLATLPAAVLPAAAATAEEDAYNNLYVKDGLVLQVDFFRTNSYWNPEGAGHIDYTFGIDNTAVTGLDAFIVYRSTTNIKLTSKVTPPTHAVPNTPAISLEDGYLAFDNTKAGWASGYSDYGTLYPQGVNAAAASGNNGFTAQWVMVPGTVNQNQPLIVNEVRIGMTTSGSTVTLTGFSGQVLTHSIPVGERPTLPVGDKSFALTMTMDRPDPATGTAPVAGTGSIALFRDTNELYSTDNANFTEKNLDINLINYAASTNMRVYGLRFYSRELTVAEMAQNHFADVAKFYRLDLGVFETLDAATKAALYAEMAEIDLTSFDRAAVQSHYNQAVVRIRIADYFESAVEFIGYQIRIKGNPGIRANYTLNPRDLRDAEAAGMTLEAGILYTDADEETVAELRLIEEDGVFGPSENVQIQKAYTTADGYLPGCYTEGSDLHIVAESLDLPDSALETDFRYRAYIAARGEGGSYAVFYYDSTTALGAGASPFDIADYLTYTAEGAAGTVQGGPQTVKRIIETVWAAQGIPAVYARINEIGAKSYEDTQIGELNELYNYQCRANRDPAFGAALCRYEADSRVLNLYTEIDNCFARYSASHGVDITKQGVLYEITDATEANDVYLAITTSKSAVAYTVGDAVTFQIAVKSRADGSLAACHHLAYEYSIDGVSGKRTGTVSAETGHATITIPASEIAASSLCDAAAGTSEGICIRMYLDACKEDGTLLSGINTAAGTGYAHHGYAGAIIDIGNISLAVEEPADFAEFWTEQMARLYTCNPCDTTLTPYTGSVVTEPLYNIEANNYYHVKLLDSADLDELIANGQLSAGAKNTYLNSFYTYEIYLKCPGPNSVGAYMTVPKAAADTGKTLPIRFAYQGYSASSPGLGGSSEFIYVSVSHASYLSGQDAAYYQVLRSGVCASYATGRPNAVNAGFADRADNYALYMFLRDFQVIRWATDDTLTGRVDTDGNPVKIPWNGQNIEVTGGSMGGYQSLFLAGLPTFVPEGEAPVPISLATPSIPAIGNMAAYTVDGRINNIFGFNYEGPNMNYFDIAMMAAYISEDCAVDITRVGICDYTSTPYAAITAFNRMVGTNKTIRIFQNSDHSVDGKVTLGTGVKVEENAVYVLTTAGE